MNFRLHVFFFLINSRRSYLLYSRLRHASTGRTISLLRYQRAAFSGIGTDNKRAIGNRSRINLLMDPPGCARIFVPVKRGSARCNVIFSCRARSYNTV